MKITIFRIPVWGMSPKSRSAAWVMTYTVIATYKGQSYHTQSLSRLQGIKDALERLL